MNFTNDIFISYKSSEDSFSDVSKAWVNAFIYYLETLLKKLLDVPPRIILSDNLTPADRHKILSETTIFIPVLSFETLESAAYKEELTTIESILEGTNEKSSYSQRLFPVLRSCVSIEQLPPFMRESKYFDFCNITPDTESFKKNTIRNKSQSGEQYWNRMVELAYNIKGSLDALKKNEQGSALSEERNYVYLANTSLDQQYYREQIKHELEHMGFSVLPDTLLSNNGEKAEKQVRMMMEKCFLSIHIIGETYGKFLVGSDYSAIDLQNRVASRYQEERYSMNGNASGSFSRIIWMASGMKPDEEKQASYIEQLNKDKDLSSNVEIMQAPLEMLKSLIHKKVKEYQQSNKTENTSSPNSKSVYFLYEKKDEGKIKPFTDWFSKNEYKLLKSIYNTKQQRPLETHRENLAHCDVAFVYFPSGNQQWIKIIMQDIIKADGYRHNSKKPARKIIYTSSVKALPVDFLTEDMTVIENETIDADALDKAIIK